MNTRDKIIKAALDIASEKGLSKTSLGDIAKRIGIKKPSIYNHFSSKEDLVLTIYTELRGASSGKSTDKKIDWVALISENTPNTILNYVVDSYMQNNSEQNINSFYKIVESEKYFDNNAALVVIEESKLMLDKTRILLQQLVDLKKLSILNVDVAAYSFTYTIHEMITELELRKRCNKNYEEYKEALHKFIDGFVEQYKII